MNRDEKVGVLGKILKRTEKAILFEVDEETQGRVNEHLDPIWLPLSQVEIEEDDDLDCVLMPGWLAAKHDLVDAFE